jgi:peroxiredoxin
MIRIGDRLPQAEFPRMSPNGPETVALSDLMDGRRIVVIGVPGAFTPTCDGKHLPSFVRTKAAIRRQGRGRDHLRLGERRPCHAALGGNQRRD